MPDDQTAAPPAVKATPADRAAEKLQADNAKAIDDQRAEQRAILDEHEAAAYARAHGAPVEDED